MPRKPLIEKHFVLEALKCFPGIFSEEGKLQTSSSVVWKDACLHPSIILKHYVEGVIVSEKAAFKPKQLHDYVYQNRYNLLNDLRVEFGFPSANSEVQSSCEDANSSTPSRNSENDSNSPDIQNEKVFHISIPYDDYLKMEPSFVIYKESNVRKRRKVLKRDTWTNSMVDHFFKKHQLPFKKHQPSKGIKSE